MILEAYALFVTLALALVLAGLWANNAVLSSAGGVALVLLGILLTRDGYEYRSGSETTVSGSTYTTTYNYATDEARTVGILFTLVGFAAFLLPMFDYWRTKA